MIFALLERPGGVETQDGACVVYDLEGNRARFGAALVSGPALVWKIGEEHGLVAQSHKASPVALSVAVKLDAETEWIVRCDRVDFPPSGVAYRHAHPGPGIRRLLRGELTIARDDGERTYRAGESWFEGAGDPVTATASATGETAFVRVLLLPSEWVGKRTIRYLDPADEKRPKLQRATVLLEEPLAP